MLSYFFPPKGEEGSTGETVFQVGSGSIRLNGKLKVRRPVSVIGSAQTGFSLSGKFKERHVVIHPTLLSCINEGEVFSTLKDVDDQDDFPLPSANCISMIQSKDNRLVLMVKAKMQYEEGKGKELIPHKNANILKEITIKFENSESRDHWLKSIVATCEKNYLIDIVFVKISDIGDEGFFKDAYQEIWIRILLEWPKLDSVRKLFTHLEGSIELILIQQTIRRITHWIEILVDLPASPRRFGKEHASVFVKFLIQAINNHGFRVLLFLFEPTKSFLGDFLKDTSPMLLSELSPKKKKEENPENAIAAASPMSPYKVPPLLPGGVPLMLSSPSTKSSNNKGHPILATKQFLGYVEHIANTDLTLHGLMFEKARHPLTGVSNLHQWPRTGKCAEEKEWNDRTRSETMTWSMMYSVLHDPPFLPYRLIMREIKDVISDDTMERVVHLMEDLPPQYYALSFNSLNTNTQEKHGTHFLNLANFCKFREMWKIFAVNQFNLQFNDEHSYAFAQAVFRQMWGYISGFKPKGLTRMFLFTEFDDHLKEFQEQNILEVLRGIIFIRLAQGNEHTMKVIGLAGTKLPKPVEFEKYRASETRSAFLQLEKLQSLASRVVRWVECITGRSVGSKSAADTDARLFVLLWNLCVENFVFRAFLLTVKPSASSLKFYADDILFAGDFNESIEDQCKLALQFVNYFTERFRTLHSNDFHSFLLIFSHPFKDFFQSTMPTNFSICWEEEIKWMKENLVETYGREWDGFEISYSELKKCLSETPFLTFQLFLCHSRSKTTLQSLELLEKLPKNIVFAPFAFYRFNGEFSVNERNVVVANTRFVVSNDLDLFDDTHFKSVVNMHRLICAWDLITPISQGENPPMTSAFISGMWIMLNNEKTDEDSAFGKFFSPFTKKLTTTPHLLWSFQDMMPLILSNVIKGQNVLLTEIFKFLQPDIVEMITADFSQSISETQKAGLRFFVTVLVNWLLKFLGIHGLDNVVNVQSFGTLFALLFRQSIYSFSFRAMICLLDTEFGLAEKAAELTGEEMSDAAERLIRRLTVVASIEKAKEVQIQSLGYFANFRHHPVASYSKAANTYSFQEVSWDQELEWINRNRSPWTMNVSDFQFFLSSPASLAFKHFVRSHRSTGNDLSHLVKQTELIPHILIKESFESGHEHLMTNSMTRSSSSNQLAALDAKPIKGRHFTSLFKQPIFQALWDIFLIPAMRPTQFVQKTYLLLWENVISHNKLYKKMFNLADSRREFTKVCFTNLLQCKLLVKLNKNADIGIDQLLCDVDQAEIAEMKKFVAEDEPFIAGASIESVISRIMQWTQCLCSKPISDLNSSVGLLQEITADDALVFLELLDACIQDSLFRVLLFLFLPSTSLLKGYVHSLDPSMTVHAGSERGNAIKLIQHISNSIRSREWKLHRNSLSILSYSKPDMDGTCDPTWQEESKWIEDFFLKRDQDLRIDWEELACCLTPSAALSYTIMTKVINVKYRSQIIQNISAEYLTSSFRLPNKSENPVDHHFYYLCLHEHLGEIQPSKRMESSTVSLHTVQDVFPVFIKFQLVNDLFVERILKYAFRDSNKSLLSGYEIVRELVLTTTEELDPVLRLHTLSMFSNLSQILIDTLYDAANATTVSGSKLTMCRFLELLLYLENTMDHPKLCNLIHVSKLFKLQPRYKEKVRKHNSY
jgi:hypothetical protein